VLLFCATFLVNKDVYKTVSGKVVAQSIAFRVVYQYIDMG